MLENMKKEEIEKELKKTENAITICEERLEMLQRYKNELIERLKS